MMRIEAILENPPKKGRQIVATVFTSVLVLLVFVASYFFILQPDFGLPVEDKYELNDNALVADDSNCYLVKQSNGTYLFYFLDYPPEVISKEDVESGMYEGYPVYEK